ncbi:acyl-CoA dehydrogenase family protein [Streptomyces sp. NPDC002888]|uniref:acyl-CoA dehydrogenase family protein n=1 Tax=Streptomyces sp. NPDC002888 TaxID=3364668 RepID=UPI0036D137E3
MTTRAHAVDIMNRGVLGHRTLDEEVSEVRREARERFARFVLEDVNPGTHFRNHARRPLDRRLFEQAGELGLLRFSLPVEVGGDGRDKLAWGVVVEEIARLSRDPGFAVLLDISVEIAELLLSSGRRELIDRYVPDLMAGRRFGVQGAYENRDPYDYRSTARLEGDEWVLNGAKRFLAGARFADLFLLFLRDEASNDMLAFAVEKDDPGVTAVAMDTMGLHTMGLGQVLLHDVRLPQWRLVWRADALSELNTYARIRRTMSACGVLGALDGVVDTCVEALSARRRGGRAVLEYTNVERSVGEMRMLLQSARASVHRALDGTRSPDRDPHFDEFATVAKHQAADCALRISHLVMGLQGGEAYMSAFPWERFTRDVLGLVSGQGSQETLLIQLGQRVITTLEGDLVREEATERAVTVLADQWWALHAVAVGDGPGEFAEAVRGLVEAARLEAPGLDERPQVSLLLDRAHALVADVRAGRAPEVLPVGPDGRFGGRLGEVAAGAWGFVACVVAYESGLLTRLLRARTAREAAGDLPVAFTEGLLALLAGRGVVRRDGQDDEGRFVLAPGLEQVVVGGGRGRAFAARLRRALAGGALLRAGVRAVGRESVPGCGGEAAVLAEVLVGSLLGRLEGLAVALDRSGARVGCAAGDESRSAAELTRQIPYVPVLDDTDLGRADRLALAWLPVGGLTTDALRGSVTAAARGLEPGGWLVLPCPLAPRRPLGAAALHLALTVTGATAPSDDEVTHTLREAGLGHIHVAWEDRALGLRLIAARRP